MACIPSAHASSKLLNSSSFSAALLGTVWVFLTGGILLSFFFLIFTIHFRKNRIVKMSSPNLNIVTLLGSGLTYCSAFLFGIEKQNSLTRSSMEILVQARVCLLCIGVTLTFGPILGKSWRLYKVFTQQVPDKRVIIKDFQLLLIVSMFVLVDITLLLAWIFLDPVQCLQSLNVDLKVTEKGLICTVSQGYFCMSLYSDLWHILFLGFKGSLLMYGAYLAGLTDDLSCPPVNQSLTLIVGIVIIFLSTGITLVVNRFFHMWHNLVLGFTSGGIFVCTSAINCLIFIPQVRQWKAFKKADISNMTKYFANSSKNFHSTMYSDEEIYQLLGEKNSMMQQLAKKDTAIASLQEQVNNANAKLMILMAIEGNCQAVDSSSPPPPHAMQAHCTANCSSIAAENSSRNPCAAGPELKPWQYSKCSTSQYREGWFSKKDCLDHLEWTKQQNIPEECTSECRIVNECKIDNDSSVKHSQNQWLSQYTTSLHMGTQPDSLRQSFSALNGEAKQTCTSPTNQKQLSGICYVNSEKFEELLQESSMNCSFLAKTPSRGPEQDADHEIHIVGQPQEILANFMKLSPYKTRQEKSIPLHSTSMAPSSWCNGNKTSSRTQEYCRDLTEFSWTAASKPKDGSCLPSLSSVALKKTLHCEAANWSRLSHSRGLLDEMEDCVSTFYPSHSSCHREQGFLTHTDLDPLPSEHLDTDSESSSSCGMPHCHHRQWCELCHSSLSSSTDSCTTGADPQPGMAAEHCVEFRSKSQPIVNFSEDLEPTYV
uniref:G protein-coupled receptor 156 n=1 Tax=Varanus komodoensis TaxID=61221 RepID=A0A8D2KVS8_VARKO